MALDFPGCGQAPPMNTLSLEALADYVVDRVPGSLDVVGLSLGGAVAQHIGLRHPGRVRSMVIACTVAVADQDALLKRARVVEEGGMDAVLAETMERWFTSAALAQPDHRGVKYARDRLQGDDPRVFSSYWRALAAHDVQRELANLRMPVTVLAGEHDAAVRPSVLRSIAERLPRGRFELLPGPHMLQLETPELFADALTRHFGWIESQTAGPTV